MGELTPERRARINRIKKVLVRINFTVLFVLFAACILLLIRNIILSERVETLNWKLLEAEKEINNKLNTEDKNSEPEIPTEDLSSVSVNPELVYEKIAYLTFDDGPSENTVNILDILDRYKVKATFFVNGKEGAVNEERYKEIAKRGHSIGLHSYTHNFEQVYESVESFSQDTERIHAYIQNITGVDTCLYRFPGGSSTTRTANILEYIDYIGSIGYKYFDWNVSSGDAAAVSLTAENIVENVMNGVTGHNRVIILMHDSAARDTTVEALPTIIEKLLNEGYEILPIVETTTPVHHTVN